MESIHFRPLSLNDCKVVQQHVISTECRNCDLNFMNLMSWRFLFETELAFCEGWLLFRFKSSGHFVYLPPIGGAGDWKGILQRLEQDATEHHEVFTLMGVCELSLARLNETMPKAFMSEVDRSYSDYIYLREKLAVLAGRKMQPKRNHVNRFIKEYPDYQYTSLSPTYFGDCLRLVEKWHRQKNETLGARLTLDEELQALRFTFEHWTELSGEGGVLMVDRKIVAFTYGAPINYDTFDVCVEKADINFDGAFAMINREFARHLPAKYVYVNREEDLGIEGLRQAKLSYHPEYLLHKYTVKKM